MANAEINYGETSERQECGLTSLKEARLQRRALKWVGKGQRFPTRSTLDDIHEDVAANGGATLIQSACITTHRLLQSDDERTLGVAAKIVVDMERINQPDEIADEKLPDQQQHVHFHQHSGETNGTGLHSAERLQRLRACIAQRDGSSVVGAPGGDRARAGDSAEPA